MMTARVFAAALLALLSAAAPSAFAGSYAYFDRPEPINPNSHAAVSSDVYVRGFGWAWGDLRFGQDTSAAPTQGRQAHETTGDPRDLAPGRRQDNSTPARHPRGKISMNLAAVAADDGPAIVPATRSRSTAR